MWYWLFAKYNLSRFLWISFLLFAAGHGLQAGLIAHYDFSDGDLLDNEVGPAHALRAVQMGAQGVAEEAGAGGNVSVFEIPEVRRALRSEAAVLEKQLETLPPFQEPLQLDSYGYHSDYLPVLESFPEEPRWIVRIPFETLSGKLNEVILIPALERRFGELKNYGWPKRFRVSVLRAAGGPGSAARKTVLADWLPDDAPDPGRGPLSISVPPAFQGHVTGLQLEVFRGAVENGKEYFALDEVFCVIDGDIWNMPEVEVRSELKSLPYWGHDFLIDQKTNLGMPLGPESGGASGDFIVELPEARKDDTFVIECDLGENKRFGWLVLFPARAPEGILIPGYGYPGEMTVEFLEETGTGERQERFRWKRDQTDPKPGNNAVHIPGSGLRARWIRIYASGLPVHNGRAVLGMGEIQYYDKPNANESIQSVRLEGFPKAAEQRKELLHDLNAGGLPIMIRNQWLADLEKRQQLSDELQRNQTEEAALSARWERFWFVTGWSALVVVLAVAAVVATWTRILRIRSRRKLERKLEQEHQKAELEQMKLRFFTHISHELRTPISVASGCLETLVNAPLKDRPKQAATMGFSSIQRLQLLVDQILDARRIQEGVLVIRAAPNDVVGVVSESIDAIRPLAESKEVALCYECEHREWQAVFDAEKLRKIMGNLLSNAIKYTPGGGRVTVSLRLVEEEPAAVSSTTNTCPAKPRRSGNLQPSTAASNSSDSHAVIMVEDSGTGISPTDLPHIFEQFYRTGGREPVKAPGSGIGLALVKELVNLWGGQIAVESPVADGKGTKFTVTLPLTKLETGNGLERR